MKRFGLALLTILVLASCSAACAMADLTPVPITLNTDTRVTFAYPGDVALFSFTPARSGVYTFRSFDNQNDPYGYLFDDEMELITYNDDSYEDYNFRIRETLTAGNTYYLGVRNYSERQTGGMTVRLELQEGLIVDPGETFVYCMRNDRQELYVDAFSDAGGVTRQWYLVADGQEQAIVGATGAAYVFPQLTENRMYRCKVSDAQGRTEIVDYDVRINPRVNLGDEEEIEATVAYNGSYEYTMEATADYGELSYRWEWYRQNEITEEWEYVTVSNQARMAATEICEARNYVCYVTDVNEVTYEKWLLIRLKNDNFTLTADSPTSLEVPAGQEITLQVHPLTDSGPFHYTYRWDLYSDSEGWSEFSAEGPTLTVPAQEGSYNCYVYDGCGNSQRMEFQVTVTSDMTISAEGDTELAVAPDAPATMKVNASSSAGGITYQWYLYNNAFGRFLPVTGMNSATYAISRAETSGRYLCKATDAAGISRSKEFTIEIVNHLSARPEGSTELNLNPGETATLKVIAASDDDSVTYRWYMNEYDGERTTRIDGADSNTLTVTGNGGWTNYRCKVADAWGNTEYVSFVVRFDNNLTVSPHEAEITAAYNGSATMTVTASANLGDLSYQWYLIEMDPIYGQNARWPIDGENGNVLTVSPVTKTAYYQCVVTDEYDSEDYADFTILIDNGLTAAADGEYDFSVEPLSSVTMKVTASCTTGSDEMTYEWYRNEDYRWQKLENTSTILTIPAAGMSDTGDYRCVVTDIFGNSRAVEFRVLIDNHFKAERAKDQYTVTAAYGQPATMTVNATCSSGKIRYRWYDSVQATVYSWSQNDLLMDSDEAGAGSFTIPELKAYGHYLCDVSDEYGNSKSIWFETMVENGLTIVNMTPRTVYTSKGGSATMTVRGSCSTGELTYAWVRESGYDENQEWHQRQILSETGPSLTVNNVQTDDSYQCYVIDQYGNRESVTFTVTTAGEGLYAESDWSDADTYGGTATMTVYAWSSEGEISYTWYRSGESDPIADATGAVLTIPSVTEPMSFQCIVSDGTNTQTLWFTVRVNIHMKVSTDNPEIRLFTPGETETLHVEATSDDNQITYSWSKNGEQLENVTGDCLTISGQDEPGRYTCYVDCSYGNSTSYDFYRMTAAGNNTLTLNQQTDATITEGNRILIYTFTPAESGEYSFASYSDNDTYGYLFDSDRSLIERNDDDGAGNNFLITQDLSAGRTYYLAVRFYSIGEMTGTIPVKVFTGEYSFEKDGGTLYLRAGQSAYLPEYYGNSDSYDSAESGNSQVAAINGRTITAGTAGQTTLQSRYGEMKVNYTVIVENAGAFVLPEALEEIEDEAFAGVDVRYLEVGQNIDYIDNDAFSGSGIHQAKISGYNTTICEGALSDGPFTIICQQYSEAWYYAQKNGCPWLEME